MENPPETSGAEDIHMAEILGGEPVVEKELAAEIDDIIQNLADSDKGCILDRDEGIRDTMLPTIDLYNAIHIIHVNVTTQMDLIGLYG